MTTLTATENLPKVLRIYFLKPARPDKITDVYTRLFNKGVRDYQRAWGWVSNCSHVVLQLGRFTYEVCNDGTISKELGDGELEFPNRQLGYWELDLDYYCVDKDKIRAADFVCKSSVGIRRLDVKHSFSYVFRHKLGLSLYPSVPLPYTCTTMANWCLQRLLGLEPAIDSHVPASLLLISILMSEQGIGEFVSYGEPAFIEYHQ